MKLRIPRSGEGRSGGYRTLVAVSHGRRAVFLYGFAKSSRANITAKELRTFREASSHLLQLTEAQIRELVLRGDLVRVKQ